jgi:regulator of protease activity HflC (stomatin/prohibitin superfamily)
MITVNSNREAIQAQIEKDVTLAAESLFGITPHSLQIAAIKPSENFMHSIDQATMAKNAAVAAENQLRTKQFEAQQVAATAKGAADAQVEQARGQAESAKIVANAEKIRLTLTADGTAYARTTNAAAEAQAIEATGLATAHAVKAQAEALRSAPELTEWTKATRWDGKLPSQMFAGAPIPFLNIGK